MNRMRRYLLWTIPAAWAGVGRAAAIPPFLQHYEQQSGGRVGVYVRNLITGASVSWRAQERFVMCSTFKASLVAQVLARVDQGSETLHALVPYGEQDLLDYAPVATENLEKGVLSIEQLCQAAVELSDNTCANLLLDRVGGPAALTAFWRATGDLTSRLDDHEPGLNRTPPGHPENTTTPEAMAGTLHRLLMGQVLLPPSQDLLRAWMSNCRTGANRLRGGLPARWTIANKTGNNGRDAAGDIALLWSPSGHATVVSVYVQGGSPTPDQVSRVFASVAAMATTIV
jgi:beta-lactamase class A